MNWRALLQGDPFKTLFVGRLSFDATEKKLQREFEEYGPIKAVTLVHSTNSGEWPPLWPPLQWKWSAGVVLAGCSNWSMQSLVQCRLMQCQHAGTHARSWPCWQDALCSATC